MSIHPNKVRVLFWIVSIIGVMITSILAILVSPLSESHKALISGILLASYGWIVIVIILTRIPEDD